MHSNLGQQIIEQGPADIVPEDVDPSRGQFAHPGPDIFGLVVDGLIKAANAFQPSAFFGSTRYANDAASGDLGDLSGDGAGGARRAGDHDRIARKGLAVFFEPKIGGHAGNAQRAQIGG